MRTKALILSLMFILLLPRDSVALRLSDHLSNEMAAEYLLHAEDIGWTYDGEAIQLNLNDCLFDGRSIAVAWDTRNKTASPLFILWFLEVDGIELGYGTTASADTLFFLDLGETMEHALQRRTNGWDLDVTRLADPPPANTATLRMRVWAFRPTGEIVVLANGVTYLEDLTLTQNVYAEGNTPVVIDSRGEAILLFNGPSQQDPAYPEALVATGALEIADAIDYSISVDRVGRVISALPGGEPATYDMGDYQLCVTQAEMTASTITIILEHLFDDQASAVQAATEMAYLLKDIDSDDAFMSTHGFHMREPVKQEDGRWLWRYRLECVGLSIPPRNVLLIPITYSAGPSVFYTELGHDLPLVFNPTGLYSE